MKNRHPETNILVSLFKQKAEKGEAVTYEEMSDAIGRSVRKNYRHTMRSAITILQEDYGYVARCTYSVGYKFVKNNGVAAYESNKFRTKINNHVDRFNDKLSTLEYHKLSDEDLKEALQASIISNSVSLVAGDDFYSKTREIATDSFAKSISSIDSMDKAKEAIKELLHGS